MSETQSSHLDFEWLGVPDSGDPLESRTWARLAWHVAGITLTRVYDRKARGVRENIYVPLYPLASWIVANWWALLFEPWPFDGPIPAPEADVSAEVQAWLQRHCIRVSNPGFASPFACIFNQGSDVAVVSRADPRGRYSGLPVDFTEDAEGSVSRQDLQDRLASFVQAVLDQLSDSDDARVHALREDWLAIRNTSSEEAEFCRAAGRLGLDPYDLEDWPEGVRRWLEHAPPGVLDDAFAIDLLEAPDPSAMKPGQHAALRQIVEALALMRAPDAIVPRGSGSAYNVGYALARWVRERMGLVPGQPIVDIREASEAACGRALDVKGTSMMPEGRVLSVVGWKANSVPLVATRTMGTARESSMRFLMGRGLYMALRETDGGPRLVTDARTWDQRASRAFAAELLAPSEQVKSAYASIETRQGRDEADATLAERYNVSPMVIRHQMENVRGRLYG